VAPVERDPYRKVEKLRKGDGMGEAVGEKKNRVKSF
jgi:hypothetical protein